MWKPSLVIGPPGNPYMLRYHLLRVKGWQVLMSESGDSGSLQDNGCTGKNTMLNMEKPDA